MKISFRNFDLPINEEFILIFIVITGISYIYFFGKHHKRNEMKFSEIYPLVINFLGLSIISFFLLVFGIDTVFTGYVYNEHIADLIKELVIGFAIISLVIINFIFYVKKHKIDLNTEIREAEEEKNNYIGEIIEIIIFISIIIVSIHNIYVHIDFIDKMEKYRQIGSSILCIISTIFLLYNLNPLEIKGKIKNLFKK